MKLQGSYSVGNMAFRCGQKYEKYKIKTRIKICIQKLRYVSRELCFQSPRLKLIKNKTNSSRGEKKNAYFDSCLHFMFFIFLSAMERHRIRWLMQEFLQLMEA